MNYRQFFTFVFVGTGMFFWHGNAQIPITSLGTPYTQNFTIGTSAAAALPASWRADKNNAAVRAVGAYSAAATATEQRAGNSMSSTATNGIYNYAAGDPATATDRAIGFIASSSGTKSGNLYAFYVNNALSSITSLFISYAVEKYRNGSNSAGFSIQLYYSADGATWTPAGASFLTSFSADADNNGYATAPGMTIPVSGALVVSVPVNGDFYLAWNYSVASGSTTSNAQGIGIDDVSVTAYGGIGPQPTTVQFASSNSSFNENTGAVSVSVSIANPSPTSATNVQVALTGGTAMNGVDVIPPFTTQTLTFPAGSGANQSISFTIFDDNLYEGDETLIFQLLNVTGGTSASIGSVATHTVTIVDNDPLPPPSVIVNEYFNSNGDISTYEAIELIVVQDGLDMRGFSLADGSNGGIYPYGFLTFSNDPLWSNLQAGTIILIGGIFSIPFQDTDPSDGLLMIQAPGANSSNRYFASGGNVITIAAASDAVAIRDANGNFIHGLAHGSANQLSLPAGRHGWIAGSVAGGQSVVFIRTSAPMTLPDFLLNSFVSFAAATLGDPNDAGGNRAYLRSARSRIVTANRALAGTFFWDITLNSGTVTLNAAVNIGNNLTINEGTFNENGFSLALIGNGNAQNGAGAGNLTVGDNAGALAALIISTNFGTISGTLNFNKTDGLVEYRGACSQTILPTAYNNLNLVFGNASNPKTLSSSASVNGTLSIGSGAHLIVAKPHVITLGSSSVFDNSGRFIGSIQTTRNISAIGLAENFGGIGLSVTPNSPALPGSTTVKMTSGDYIWVDNLPSILKYYSVSAANGTGINAALAYQYDTADLNGQTETNLGLKNSTNGGIAWSNMPGSLNIIGKTITHNASNINGLWTAHANPPQGTIKTDKVAISFETEQDGPLPLAETVNVSNLNGNGSIIEWTASAATIITPTWLRITPSPASGVNGGNFVVEVIRANLLPGTYSGTVTITDIHATNNPVIIPVSFLVHAKRQLCIGVDTIFIKATFKKANPAKLVTIENCGGSFGSDVIKWSVSTKTSWLTLAPDSGIEGKGCILTANTLHLDIGTYYGSITIAGTHSVSGMPISNSPLLVPVVLEVEPLTAVVAATGPLTSGNSRTIYNAVGQRVAKLTVNSGSITNISMKMIPNDLPSGISRLRYANRCYYFETDGTNYDVDVTLYYTSNELLLMMITEPSELRGWRQYPAGGVWHPTISSSSPISNSVTISAVTDLNGIWAMASSYFPIAMQVRALNASWKDISSARVSWSSSLSVSDAGFLLERTIAGRNDWRTVAIVPPSPEGEYSHIDATDNTYNYEYRLLAFDRLGTAYESEPVTLSALTILSADVITPGAGIELSQNAPNPISVSSGISGTIRFSLPASGHVTLKVYDIDGREILTVINGYQTAGEHVVTLRADGFESGAYLYRLQFGPNSVMRKMIVIR